MIEAMSDLSAFLPFYALIVAVAILVWLLIIVYATRRSRHARNAPALPEDPPLVTIIVAALNEERSIEGAMRSLLALDYPAIEIIAADDRSTDRTGEILDRLASASNGRLRVLHITHLPDGWLGKCNALATAARHARGEWLLFTDADVHFDPAALRAAVASAHAHRADHIVLFPQMLWRDYIEAALLTLFSISLTIAYRTWRVESKSLRAFIGIGAFNMIRRELYEQFGGHEPLRLEVADDMKLGYLAKKHGGRSLAINSDGLVRVRWRQGAGDVVRGIERSGFAGVDFRWGPIVAAIIFYPCVLLAPYLLLLSGSLFVVALSLLSLVMLHLLYAVAAHGNGVPLWIGLLHPAASLLFVYALARSAVMTTIRGGVTWRGNFYTVEELRRGSVR